MKIDVKEKLVKVGEKIDAESKLLVFKSIEKQHLLSITIPSVGAFPNKYDMIYQYENSYEFSIYDEELGYIDFKIKPDSKQQEENAEDLILAFALLHKN